MYKINISIGLAISSILLITGCSEAPPPAARPATVVKKIDSVTITGSATALKRLTVGGGNEKAASLSKSGKWLLSDVSSYDKDLRKNTNILEKIDIENPNIKMILTPSNSDSIDACWMPDEKSFVYASNRMGNNVIVQSLGVNGGSGVKFLTKNSLGNAKHPNISSDGKQVVFDVNGNIAVIDTDGNNMIMYGQGYRPKFSNNNNTILYVQESGKYNHIYTMSLDGTNMLQLTSESVNDYAAIWSPDNHHIAFVSDRVGGKTHLFIMDRSGGNILQLTDGEYNITSVVWGDDGYIYFSANLDNNEDIWRLKPILN